MAPAGPARAGTPRAGKPRRPENDAAPRTIALAGRAACPRREGRYASEGGVAEGSATRRPGNRSCRRGRAPRTSCRPSASPPQTVFSLPTLVTISPTRLNSFSLAFSAGQQTGPAPSRPRSVAPHPVSITVLRLLSTYDHPLTPSAVLGDCSRRSWTRVSLEKPPGVVRSPRSPLLSGSVAISRLSRSSLSARRRP